jgi:hypothetical protein
LRPYLKNKLKQKELGGVAQVVECFQGPEFKTAVPKTKWEARGIAEVIGYLP